MKDLDLWIFVAVFQEMLGPLFWLIAALAVGGVAMLLIVLVRDRGVLTKRLVLAELVGLAGGVGAVLVMWAITQSGPSDIGGPIDWVLIAAIWLVGALGATVLAYGALGLAARRA
jgi:hypothetical protein